MKKASWTLALLLLLTLSGCGWMQNTAGGEDVLYHSDTAKEDCYLCGGKIETLEPFYWGQENIALISLNTFEVIPIEINRYDRLNRRMIEEYAGVVSFGGGKSESGGFSADIMLDYDRGYATGSLRFYEDETLDTDKVAVFLCADCLDKILPQNPDQCIGVGIIHLATKEVRIFEEFVAGFCLGDFYVDCNFMEDPGRNSRWLDLLVFYCPERYGNNG